MLDVGRFVNVEIDSQTQAVVDTVERVLAERQDQLTTQG
jgi:riboflavin synthase alpha subunit